MIVIEIETEEVVGAVVVMAVVAAVTATVTQSSTRQSHCTAVSGVGTAG